MYAVKKPMPADPNEERLARWTRCRLTGDLLTEPVAMDELGWLYNKEALVSALVTRAVPAGLSHLTGLRDVITLRLQRAPPQGGQPGPFCCPLSGLEFNGKNRFTAFWPSGHVFSASALKARASSPRRYLPICLLLSCDPPLPSHTLPASHLFIVTLDPRGRRRRRRSKRPWAAPWARKAWRPSSSTAGRRKWPS